MLDGFSGVAFHFSILHILTGNGDWVFEPEDYRNVSLPDTLDAMDSLIKHQPGVLKGDEKGIPQ